MKIFIAGPRAVTALNEQVRTHIKSIVEKGMTILVGDANGVDRLVQKYVYDLRYSNVRIYASNGRARNNLGNWPVTSVDAGGRTGFAFYAAKDIAMANDADYGFMIWNGQSKGTLSNIVNLIERRKPTLVYFLPDNALYRMTSQEMIRRLVRRCGGETMKLYENILSQLGL